jgi:hypothetical protein
VVKVAATEAGAEEEDFGVVQGDEPQVLPRTRIPARHRVSTMVLRVGLLHRRGLLEDRGHRWVSTEIRLDRTVPQSAETGSTTCRGMADSRATKFIGRFRIETNSGTKDPGLVICGMTDLAWAIDDSRGLTGARETIAPR